MERTDAAVFLRNAREEVLLALDAPNSREEIRHRLGLAMLFITHDLRVAAQVCDTIAVMRQGRVVELNTAREVFQNPQHPYTRTLLDAIPGKGWEIPESLQNRQGSRTAGAAGRGAVA